MEHDQRPPAAHPVQRQLRAIEAGVEFGDHSGTSNPAACQRLTTLSVDPAHRARAFSRQLEAQLQAGMFSPLSTTLEQLRAFAAQCVAAA